MLAYCKEYFNLIDGKLFYKKRPSNRVKVGDEVGNIGSHGYREMRCNGKRVLAHRIVWLIMTGTFPDKWIDHKDRNKLNNKFGNLRLCTSSQNQANTVSNGYKGVSRNKKKWRARIMFKRKEIRLGNFDNQEDAARAYDIKALELFGEFAKLNFGIER